MILFTLACLFFLPNYERALTVRSWNEGPQAFERDMQAGVPPFILADRHGPTLNAAENDTGRLAQALRNLKEAKIPQFQAMATDPTFREVPLPVTPSALDGVVWKDGVGYSCSRTPADTSLAFSLDRPRFVYAIRLRCSYEGGAGGSACLKVDWGGDDLKDAGDSGGPGGENREGLTVSTTPRDMWAARYRSGSEKIVTFWVNSEIDRFRIHPDTKAFAFKVLEIVLLVPPDDPLMGDPKP